MLIGPAVKDDVTAKISLAGVTPPWPDWLISPGKAIINQSGMDVNSVTKA